VLPSIDSFGVTPSAVDGGDSVLFTWSVGGAQTLDLEPGVGTVVGTQVGYTPPHSGVYTLTATNQFGSIAAQTQVFVRPQISITPNPVGPITAGNALHFTANVVGGEDGGATWALTQLFVRGSCTWGTVSLDGTVSFIPGKSCPLPDAGGADRGCALVAKSVDDPSVAASEAISCN